MDATNVTAKLEYDARLGGSVQLPDSLATYRYSADRVAEIKSLLGAIRNPNQTKLVFQTLPVHMRRRAMSHNPKRLPRRHRAAHIAQQRKSGGPAAKVAKRPSRKYRRKAGNLQREYARRQRRCAWLETHLWHAKRFHMVERWGYKLPLRSCDKQFRTAYRASADHCLLQDVSYESVIEVSGELGRLRAALSAVTSAECGLGICARTYVHGGREAVLELFQPGMYPFGAVGRVRVIWRPAEDDSETTTRTLWMFVHASFYADVVRLLQGALELPDAPNAADVSPKSYENSKTGVRLTELKDTLNRFRLTGPLANAVLAKAFQPKDATLTLAEDKEQVKQPQSWWRKYLASGELAQCAHQSQCAYWRSIAAARSATELTPSMVLALNIEDPRLTRPQKRTKAEPSPMALAQLQQSSLGAALQPPALANCSGLWSTELRQLCTTGKMSSAEYCKQRNLHVLVPGERCAFEDRMQAVPLLLVQRPGSEDGRFKRLGYGGGWDVIVPAGYGISTWMCLIMWGARAGGLRETETVSREGGRDEFWPDTVPAQVRAGEEEQRLRDEFFRKPPNKRINYTKLAINSPFRCHWTQLIADWSALSPQPSATTATPQPPFYVLRNPAHLQLCQQVIGRARPFADLLQQITAASQCLIPVHVRLLQRGTADQFALLCVPRPGDLRRNRRQLAALDATPVHTEPIRADAGETERKSLRTAHLALLKRLRGRRVRRKRRQQEHAEKRVQIAAPATAKLVREQLQRMRDLWLPAANEGAASVREQATREVLGYVTQANFSLSEATVAGVAYVSLMGLRRLVANADKVGGAAGGGRKAGKRGKANGGGGGAECCVLIRGTTTRQYRLASLKVCV